MKKYLIVLLCAFALYFLQGLLYEHGIINQAIVLLVILIGAGFWVKGLTGRMSVPFKMLSIFLCIAIVSAAYNYIACDDGMFSNLKLILMSLLPFFPFYYAGKKNVDIRQIVFVFMICFLLISIRLFFIWQDMLELELGDSAVNNFGYTFILLLPLFIISNKKTIIQLPLLLCCVAMVFLSAKRGAFLCLLGGMIVYVQYLFNRSKNANVNLRLLFQIFILAVVAGSFIYLSRENVFLLSRFENMAEGASGRARTEIYAFVYQYWTGNVTPLTFIFGFGFMEVLNLYGLYAHNDWVEVFFDFGFFGLFFYTAFLVSVFRESRFYKKGPIKYAVIAALAIWVIKSLTTGVITTVNTFLLSMIFGYASGYQLYLKDTALKTSHKSQLP